MKKERFINIGNDIFQDREWWCSAKGKRCAEVIATAMNEIMDENEQLKTLINNISDQRDEFHRGVRENANRIGKLEKENEQLKSEIKILKEDLEHCANQFTDDGKNVLLSLR